MEPNELKYWVAFARIPRIGRVRIKRLEEHFGSLANAWRAGLTELRAAGLDDRTAQLVATRKLVIDPDAELAGSPAVAGGKNVQQFIFMIDKYYRAGMAFLGIPNFRTNPYAG